MGINSVGQSLKDHGHDVTFFDVNVAIGYKGEQYIWESGNSPLWYREDLFTEKVFPIIKDHLNQEIDKIIDFIKRERVECVGIQIFSTTLFAAKYIIRRLRFLDIKIVIGGPDLSQNNSRDNEVISEMVDAIVIGEGEVAVPALIKEWESENEDFHIPGVNHLVNGIIRKTPPQLINDLSILPTVSFAGQDLSIYYNNKTVPIQTSRGCYASCSFCAETGNYRHRPAEDIFKEMMAIYAEHGTTNLTVTDSAMFPQHPEMKKLVKMLIDSGVRFSFDGNCRIAPKLTVDLLKDLHAAGCDTLIFGLESGSQKVLDFMNKHIKIEWAEANLKACKDAGIQTIVNTLIGFPGEGEEEFLETVNFILRNRENISMVNVGEGLKLIGNSEIKQNPSKFGVIEIKSGRDWVSSDGKNTLDVRIDRVKRMKKILHEEGVNYRPLIDTVELAI
jgi:radical SAM superfamily enzyme YgiQ (UPF0313 family)